MGGNKSPRTEKKHVQLESRIWRCCSPFKPFEETPNLFINRNKFKVCVYIYIYDHLGGGSDVWLLFEAGLEMDGRAPFSWGGADPHFRSASDGSRT